ncbi:hypothetical protein YN70_003360 [Campylobacter coli]|uniref:Uncharacterized protein n=1 Tax=Campylobacter jejuni TaxID=197 RepID=A0A6F9MU06_CAMJU|nr:hypothetical protein [Campylobacter coli]EAH8787719.1 hypothetical protein [Campylobacter jejuni]EAL0079794.1 hypothetical protein [Campylobacter lari]EAH8344355.1 hypothetical protein [Campylobacter coli]EAI1055216.1 hypothetical protein [Campylobacter coli]
MKQWLSDFKLALIQEDIDKLESLLNTLDLKKMLEDLARDFQSDELKDKLNDNLEQMRALLQEAIVLMNAKKNSKACEIQKIQKALKYFKD